MAKNFSKILSSVRTRVNATKSDIGMSHFWYNSQLEEAFMAFRPPQFNLLANLWTCDGAVSPAGGPPDYTNVPCQKYVASRAAWPVSPPWANGFFLQFHPPIQLRFPRSAPFDGEWPMWTVTAIEVPAGSGQYYRTFWNDIQHQGFTNEYALVIAVQCTDELQAIPPAGSIELVGVGADPCGNVPPQNDIIANIPGGLNCCAGTPTPPPGPGFLDTYVESSDTPLESHTADTGETYTVLNAGQLVVMPTFKLNDVDNTGTTQYGFADYTGPTDGTITMNFVTPTPIVVGAIVGVMFRVIDLDSWWAVALEDDGFGGWRLNMGYAVMGSYSSLITSTGLSITAAHSYILRVLLSGDGIHAALVDGGVEVLSVDYSDVTYDTATGVGVVFNADDNHLSCAVGQLKKI